MHVKQVLITGAGSGIGSALCSGFLQRGLDVVAVDNDAKALNRLAEQWGQRQLQTFVMDIRDDRQVAELALALPRVDTLINNAGLQHVEPLTSFPPAKWRQLIDVMLTGCARLIAEFLPGMQEQNFGRIINIGSIHSLVGSAYKSAYVAAKHGLVGLSKVVALETAPYNITINTLCPSYVKTPLVEQQIEQQAKQHGINKAEVEEKIMLAPMPKKQFITFEELEGTIVFLMSNAARNITGQSIALDGGWTVQ